MSKTSIIIVTYNGLNDATIPCLDSVFAHTSGCDFEVIVVDNNSTDGTPTYLEEKSRGEPRLKCIFNDVNRGFAGGNNDGIRVADGDFLVLLNNDTRVTEGWLTMFVTALEDERIGLVGPVTNSVGNEQKIFTVGQTPEEILAEGMRWAEMSSSDRFETGLLGFFCVALRRQLIERVGLLDEAFGLGFYEDDDFSIRVRKAGYRLVCLENVFIFHRGSASFGSVPRETKQLMKKNKRLLDAKHPGEPRPRHKRDLQLDLVEKYLAAGRGEADRFLYKSGNRLSLAASLVPRGFFKRLAYLKRYRKLRELYEQLGRCDMNVPLL